MRTLLLGALWALPQVVSAYNYSTENPNYMSLLKDKDKPKDCPPCFNCLLPAFKCQQFADCRPYDGQCECPPGFGGQDCMEPVCGALSDGKNRFVREGKECDCKDGWNGINCNVCSQNAACAPMMPEGIEGVCYKGGITVKENYQMCQVTNRKILDQLKGQKPQVTFSCNAKSESCGFQFWVDQRESFYCGLKECSWKLDIKEDANYTRYDCEKIECSCIKERMLCGEKGSIDLSDFLTHEIKGPASFSCQSRGKGGFNDGCSFSEPNMNDLIKNVFGDASITLECESGECLHPTQVPGYKAPTKKINSPLIAGAIAGSLLVMLAIVLLIVYIHRRNQQMAGLGPIHLPDEDDDNKLITEHKPASLHFENISYSVNGRTILSGVHGAVNPGQIMAIMGASGAGKTTFLDILARKNKRGIVNGKVFVNGSKATDDEFREVIGFVDQDDTMMPTLTVYETILNSALLRLPREMKFEAKNRRVLEVMQQLGILPIKDQLIGSEDSQRGISGGEKRRVGIACELVTSPAILFLDEPTSGLDSFNAYNVVECLVNLAQNYNRTIVFTIHQPRSNIVALFDRLVLLAKGKMVYSGAYNRCQTYFSDLGYACPPGFNIADYLVDLTMHASQQRSVPVEYTDDDNVETSTESSQQQQRRRGGRKRADSVKDRQERALFTRRSSSHQQPASAAGEEVPLLDVEEDHGRRTNSISQDRATEHIEDANPPPPSASAKTDLDLLITSYINSDESKRIKEEIHDAVSQANGHTPENGDVNQQQVIGNGPVKGFERIGWWSQFSILSSRTWKNLYRNPMLMLTHYAIAILLAVLCGFLFYGITDDISGFQNRMGLFFFVLALFGFSTLTTLTVFSQERLLFMRERANGYYSPITYFAAKVVFDILPLRILPPIIMGSIIYPMVGLNSEWHSFFKFILVLVLFNLAAAAICLFIGIVFKDLGMANLVGSLVMLFSLLLAGLLLNHDSIPKTALWLQTISIFHYGFEALIVNEVRYLSLTEHKYGLDIEVPGATILSTFGFQSLAFWHDTVGLAIFSGVFIVLAYAAMHFILVEKR